MTPRPFFALQLGAALLLARAAPVAPPTLACQDLPKAKLAARTSIGTARSVPETETPPIPAHCEIIGTLNERTGQDGKPYAIGFHLRLPEHWNRRFFFQGGGGLDGYLGDALGRMGNGQTRNALAMGYAVVSTMAAASTDLRRFERRGGRIVLYHGTADPVFSSNDTIEWFEALQRGAPRGDATRVARLFLIPGMNHCGGGPATDAFDQLAPVVRWVEEGVAPDAIVARANAESPWPARTRPLCAYPKQARYAGSGDVDDARNFVCR